MSTDKNPGNTWPEQTEILGWFDEVGMLITPGQLVDLGNRVSAYRIKLQKQWKETSEVIGKELEAGAESFKRGVARIDELETENKRLENMWLTACAHKEDPAWEKYPHSQLRRVLAHHLSGHEQPLKRQKELESENVRLNKLIAERSIIDECQVKYCKETHCSSEVRDEHDRWRFLCEEHVAPYQGTHQDKEGRRIASSRLKAY